MPVHPAPPSDVPGLIEAYRQTLTSFAAVCDGLSEADWDAPTSCPGWAARDHLAHVVHHEDYLSGSEHPLGGAGSGDTAPGLSATPTGQAVVPVRPEGAGTPEHVTNDFGAWNEEGIRALREREPADLVAELRGLIELRSAQMYDPDLTLETPVRSVMGEMLEFGPLLALRLSDVWNHEQDLREVVNRPGSLDSPGASQFVTFVLDSLPRVVVRRVRPEPGTVVILESTGPVLGRAGVRVGTDADGELVGHVLFTGHVESEDTHPIVHEADEQESTTTISLSTHELTRRAAGRRSTEETAYQVVGDEGLARRVLDALTVTP